MPEHIRYVTWTTFVWIVSVVSVLMAGLFTATAITNASVQKNTVDVAVLQTQYQSIDKNLAEIKDLLKK